MVLTFITIGSGYHKHLLFVLTLSTTGKNFSFWKIYFSSKDFLCILSFLGVNGRCYCNTLYVLPWLLSPCAPKVRRPIKAACLSASIGVQMSLSTRCWPPQVTRPLLTTFRDRSRCPVTGHTVKYTQQHHHSFPRPDKGRGSHFATAVCEAHLYILMQCYIGVCL